ncbi:hypothetical protein [Streptomyces incanus]|uniref:Secreted protein n=1 Tax=Streptomyces incanus TaxID=887453 RepID=A0ABW0XJ44_9ACTN
MPTVRAVSPMRSRAPAATPAATPGGRAAPACPERRGQTPARSYARTCELLGTAVRATRACPSAQCAARPRPPAQRQLPVSPPGRCAGGGSRRPRRPTRKKGAGNLTLGADLAAFGPYRPQRLPEPRDTARVDGYEVRLDGTLRPGWGTELDLTVSRDGKPVTDLQPYLGAYGHLVALRSGDLAYLHVHPNGEPGDGRTEPGPAVSFTATAPSAGTYRLFPDFKHDGAVRTAAFTVRAGTQPGAEAGTDTGTRTPAPGAPDTGTSDHPGDGDGDGDGQGAGHGR